MNFKWTCRIIIMSIGISYFWLISLSPECFQNNIIMFAYREAVVWSIITVNLPVNFLMLISHYYVIPCHGAHRLCCVLSIVVVHADLLFVSPCTSYTQ